MSNLVVSGQWLMDDINILVCHRLLWDQIQDRNRSTQVCQIYWLLLWMVCCLKKLAPCIICHIIRPNNWLGLREVSDPLCIAQFYVRFFTFLPSYTTIIVIISYFYIFLISTHDSCCSFHSPFPLSMNYALLVKRVISSFVILSPHPLQNCYETTYH